MNDLSDQENLTQFLDQLIADRSLQRILQHIIYGAGQKAVRDDPPGGWEYSRPEWPGYRSFLKDTTPYWILNQMAPKFAPDLRALYKDVDSIVDEREFVDDITKAFVRMVPDQTAEHYFGEGVINELESLEEANDPYGSRGLNRRDFYASENRMKRDLIRLAHENPKLRRHLVPLLRDA